MFRGWLAEIPPTIIHVNRDWRIENGLEQNEPQLRKLAKLTLQETRWLCEFFGVFLSFGWQRPAVPLSCITSTGMRPITCFEKTNRPSRSTQGTIRGNTTKSTSSALCTSQGLALSLTRPTLCTVSPNMSTKHVASHKPIPELSLSATSRTTWCTLQSHSGRLLPHRAVWSSGLVKTITSYQRHLRVICIDEWVADAHQTTWKLCSELLPKAITLFHLHCLPLPPPPQKEMW